jgi:hypothetical protein
MMELEELGRNSSSIWAGLVDVQGVRGGDDDSEGEGLGRSWEWGVHGTARGSGEATSTNS